jgi:hypothetical protein
LKAMESETKAHKKAVPVSRVHKEAHQRTQTKNPPAPFEPILFPKLRIYFADFPYLLDSIDQRLLTLET